MKHADFVHLHLHTQYSLLDGAIRPKELFERAKEYNLPALAITDHGNMFGAIDFYQTAYEYGIKPIIGCEIYVAPASRFDKDIPGISEASFHLVLLVKNQIGYKNLLKLVSKAYFEGFYYRPRVDKELLKECNQGLIAMSSCLHGEIPYLIVQGQEEQALKTADEYRVIFDNNRFFLEIQENGIKEQNIANRGILAISKKLGIPIVATNDCHYLNKEDVMAHEVLVAVRTGKTLSSPDRMKFSTEELYFKPPEMMKEIFRDYPEAIKNTIEISERCNLELKFNELKFPSFPVEESETPNNALRKLAQIGLAERLQKHPLRLNPDFSSLNKQYQDRLENELEIINSEGFASYFLIVSDFVNFSKKNNIPVGPGRGSAAGSLVAYSLRITEIDPIPFGLLFERFLNPERISPPDIDIDFCMDGRDQVIEYVRNKYGNDKVAQIITFGKMKARAVVRDVGRVLDMPYKEVDTIAKLIPDTLNITINEALRLEPALRKLEEEEEKIKLLISLSRVLEGLPRHESTHAAGVVISDKPLVEYLPLCKDSKGEVATQYAMDDVAKIGLIKFDFLGLKTLTVINQTLKLINRNEVKIPDINEIPLGDKETYALLSSGETEGVFQLESSGMKELISKMQPENIDDVTDLLALYRPGPLQSGMVDDYIRRRKGETNISYLVPQLKSTLADTYGVILYQEQVMKIAQVVAGFSLGEADILRRAMGKKKVQEMEEQKEKFLLGTQKHKIPLKKAEEIFKNIVSFAGYGFNKSHSVAYALIAYQTAYLKAHYPVEFMAALLTCEMGNTDKVIRHIGECRDKGLEVLPPDVNESQRDFIVAGKKIRFGLAAVKNVGTAAIEAIIKSRDKEGLFNSIFDFCQRVDLRKVNKKVVESLIKCGAFDSTGALRSQLWALYEKAMENGQQTQKQKADKQKSLFGDTENGSFFSYNGKYPEMREWPENELLAYEKEALGFFISSHPLVSFEKELKKAANTDTKEIQNLKDGAEAKIGGVPVALNEIKTKRGDMMGFVTLEDLKGSVEVIVFAELYKKVSPIIKSEQPILVKGKVTLDATNLKAKVKAEDISLLADAARILPSTVHFSFDVSLISKQQLEKLKNILKNHPGKCPAYLHLVISGQSETVISLSEKFHLNPSEGLSKEVEYLFGSQVMTFD